MNVESEEKLQSLAEKDLKSQSSQPNTVEEDDDEPYEFLNTMILEDEANMQDIEEAVQTYGIHVNSNKPSMNVMREDLKRPFKRLERKYPKEYISRLLKRVFLLTDILKKSNTNTFCAKALFATLNSFLYGRRIPEDALIIAAQNWLKVDSNSIDVFLKTFRIRHKINKDDIVPLLTDLYIRQKYYEFCKMVSYLGIQKLFPDMEDRIKQLVHQDRIIDAEVLVADIPELQKALIREMTTNKYASKAAKLVIKYNHNLEDFAELCERLEKKCLRYWAYQEDWAKVEEKFWLHKHILGYFVEDLIFKEKMDVALSIVKRHNLLTEGFIKKPDTLEIINPYFSEGPDKKIFEDLPNLLFTKDTFMPTEEALGISEAGTFINFADYKLTFNTEIFWVEDINSERYAFAEEKLRGAKVIGFDAEFRATFTRLGSPGVATAQISTPDYIFVFDCLKLAEQPKFATLIYDIFRDPNIIIVGHTIQSDLKELKENVAFTPEQQLEIRSYCDVQAIFADLNPFIKQTGLSTVVLKTLGKQLSKFEQISNWSFRPLRQTQLHYAAMDAYILVKLYQEFESVLEKKGDKISFHIVERIGLKPKKKKGGDESDKKTSEQVSTLKDEEAKAEIEQEEEEEEEPIFIPGIFGNFLAQEDAEEFKKEPEDPNAKKKDKKTNNKPKGQIPKEVEDKLKEKELKKGEDKAQFPELDPKVSKTNYHEKAGEFTYLPKYEHIFADSNTVKFLIDNMAIKLARYMRNFGLDAEIQAEKDTENLFETAKAENRVIITRDQKAFNKRDGWPIYLLHKTNTEQQLNEILDFFKVDRSKNNLLSRCVKCNSTDLIVVDKEVVKPLLQWQNEEDYETLKPFWQCVKCKQVYWEGKTYAKAKQRFSEFKA
mmetsp:Transcript_6000/g.6553  ORF Transcript_6000/g.6553 Transcript_6000/m.6553 type:complete len:885 (-) Transcript_6000:143-2797(-)